MRAFLLLLTISFAALGCSPAGQVRPAADFGPPPSQAVVKAPALGAPAPGFSVSTLGGGTFDLSQRQGRLVGMFFMAAWCGTCVPQAKSWANVYRQYRDRGLDLLFVSADPGDTETELRHFAQAAQASDLTWALDPTGTIVRWYGVRSLDTSVTIGRDGRVAYHDTLYATEDRLRPALAKLL